MSYYSDYSNCCGGTWPNGGPEPPRLWSRSSGELCTGIPREELDMRRKVEVLMYKNNSLKQTKKERFAALAKKKSSTYRICSPITSSTPQPTSASNVPGNTYLYYNSKIPLTRYITQRQYKTGNTNLSIN